MFVAYVDLKPKDIVESFWDVKVGSDEYLCEEDDDEQDDSDFNLEKYNHPEAFWEHDRWWLRHDTGEKETIYSVVECQNKCGGDYLDFEEVSEVEY